MRKWINGEETQTVVIVFFKGKKRRWTATLEHARSKVMQIACTEKGIRNGGSTVVLSPGSLAMIIWRKYYKTPSTVARSFKDPTNHTQAWMILKIKTKGITDWALVCSARAQPKMDQDLVFFFLLQPIMKQNTFKSLHKRIMDSQHPKWHKQV